MVLLRLVERDILTNRTGHCFFGHLHHRGGKRKYFDRGGGEAFSEKKQQYHLVQREESGSRNK